jgi:hypothetical protein
MNEVFDLQGESKNRGFAQPEANIVGIVSNKKIPEAPKKWLVNYKIRQPFDPSGK